MDGRSSAKCLLAATALALVFVTGCANEPAQPQGPVFAKHEPVDPAKIKETDKPRPLTFDEEIEMADRLRDSGQFPEAAWHYIRGLQLEGDNPLPRQRMGFLHLGEDTVRGEQIFADLTEQYPDMASAHLGLGLAHISLGQLDVARKSIERSLELEPESAIALTALGYIADLEGRHAEAQARYLAAREIEPSRYEISNNLGMSYLMSEDFEAAAEAFNHAIHVYPRDPTVYNNLGVAMGRMGRYKEALEQLMRFSSRADALNNVGLISHLNGDDARAIKYYERSLLQGPTNRDVVLINLRVSEDALLVP
jgi:Flp pilus assembly protein TadD